MSDVLNYPQVTQMGVTDYIRPSQQTVKLKSNRKLFTSPYNGATQVVSAPGNRFACDMTYSNLNDEEAAMLESWLAALADGDVTDMVDFAAEARQADRQAALARTTVDGSGQTGNTLHIHNALPAALLFKKGDYVTFGSHANSAWFERQCCMVVEDCTADNLGRATVHIRPAIRRSPAAESVVTSEARFYMRTTEDENGVDRQPAFINNFSVNFEEAIW